MCQIGLILVLVTAHVERVSVSRMRDFLDGFPQISAESLSCLQLQINLRALFLVDSHKTFCSHSGLYKPSCKLLSRNSWEVKLLFCITMNLQTIVRGAHGHPTGIMISCFVPCPMNYSFVVSKHSTSY